MNRLTALQRLSAPSLRSGRRLGFLLAAVVTVGACATPKEQADTSAGLAALQPDTVKPFPDTSPARATKATTAARVTTDTKAADTPRTRNVFGDSIIGRDSVIKDRPRHKLPVVRDTNPESR